MDDTDRHGRIRSLLRSAFLVTALAFLAFPGAARATLSWSAPVEIDPGGSTYLYSVACPSSTQCTAVDGFGFEVTFNPTTGISMTPVVVDGARLYGVACPSTTQCTAVDWNGYEVTFNPTSGISKVPAPIDNASERELYSVACPSETQCTAVDNKGYEVTFNPISGTSKAPTLIDSSSFSNLNGVACPTESQCTAVDGSGNEVTFNPISGSSKAPALINEGSYLESVACPSESQCTAVGPKHEVTFNPTSGSSKAPATIDSGENYSVACPSSTQCTAADQSGQEVTFNPTSGISMTAATIDTGGYPQGVACPSETQCTAVDERGHEVTFNPTPPTKPNSILINSGNELHSVACPSSTQCTAVDEYGNEVTFNPSSPGIKTPATIDGDGYQVYSVACPSETQCTAVDNYGREVTFNPNTGVSKAPVPIGEDLFRVACPSETQCTAVNYDGYEVTFNPSSGSHETPVAIDPGNYLEGVACPLSTQCTAVDGEGNEVTFNPTTGSHKAPASIDSGNYLYSVACPSETQCTAVDRSGQEVTFNPTSGSHETSISINGGKYLYSVACPSTTQCTAVGGGYQVTFNPTSGGHETQTLIDSSTYLAAVACPSSTQCVAVDGTGHVLVGTSGTSPTVTSIEPTQGSTAAGTAVKIKGTGFISGATVKIGQEATSVEVRSETEIRAKTAAHAAGAEEVVVKDANGTSTLGPLYTYVAGAPTVATSPASSITPTSATLSATVNPNGSEVGECELEYGTSTSYGQSVPCTPAPGSGSSSVSVSAAVGSLRSNTAYHFRISATNAATTSKGSDETFTTLPAHFYKNANVHGKALAEGVSLPVISWGTLTLSSEAGTVSCKTAILGDVQNPEGGGFGSEEAKSFATADCVSSGCEAASGLEMLLSAEELPWHSTLEESESAGKPLVRAKTVGVQLSTRCTFRPGYAAKLVSAEFEEKELKAQEVARGAYTGFPTPERGRPPLINVPGDPVATCSGEDAPRFKNGSGIGSKPSLLAYDSPGSGSLSCGAFGKGTITGTLKSMGYNEQEVISAE